MNQGRILKGVGGFYDVLLTNGATVTCKARGRFRKEHVCPMVGDLVEISPQSDGLDALETILPRKNALLRPPVANIDQLVIVMAASFPRPDWLLVDKLILQASLLGIHPFLVLNKLDEGAEEILDIFQTEYSAFDILCVSSRTNEGISSLRERLSGQISCLAGQSAVGKSSILNALFPDLSLETGDLARKTERGRHTTRHAELWPYLGGAVLDTPGFSLFELTDIPQEALNASYPEFGNAPENCRFTGCTHVSEPDCKVKELLDSGQLSKGRYERYQILLEEIKQRRKHQYD